MKIIILGPQGSGKGTQAAFIVAKFKIPAVSPGEIFRAEIRTGTSLGKQVARAYNAGKMLPDAITNRLVKQRLSKPDCRGGAILDGYPRRLAQARVLQKYWQPDHVIFLDVSRVELMKRLRDRLICTGCRIAFHKIYRPSELKEICDACGGKLEKRSDDSPTAIRQRLRIYEQETVPVVKYYEKLGLVRKVNGERSIEPVWRNIQKILR